MASGGAGLTVRPGAPRAPVYKPPAFGRGVPSATFGQPASANPATRYAKYYPTLPGAPVTQVPVGSSGGVSVTGKPVTPTPPTASAPVPYSPGTPGTPGVTTTTKASPLDSTYYIELAAATAAANAKINGYQTNIDYGRTSLANSLQQMAYNQGQSVDTAQRNENTRGGFAQGALGGTIGQINHAALAQQAGATLSSAQREASWQSAITGAQNGLSVETIALGLASAARVAAEPGGGDTTTTTDGTPGTPATGTPPATPWKPADPVTKGKLGTGVVDSKYGKGVPTRKTLPAKIAPPVSSGGGFGGKTPQPLTFPSAPGNPASRYAKYLPSKGKPSVTLGGKRKAGS